MRVYEFSQHSGVSSKKLLEKLAKAGFKVASHMSALSDDAENFLKKELSNIMLERENKKQSKISPQVYAAPINPVEKEDVIKVIPQPVVEKKQIQRVVEPHQKNVILKPSLVSDIADQIKVPVNELILFLLKSGVIAPKNKVLSEEIIGSIARHYDAKVVHEEKKEASIREKLAVIGDKKLERAPIVVVMGHVDHGKTTLLDFIRKTRVAAREKGGITQHLGAYQATTDHGSVIFLDTPGHEAFTKIRSRGANVADIVILVVAADDGVMPQTIESIKIAKSMHVPIVVAINKIDKINALQLETIKRQLAQQDLLPEEWGGETVIVPISAKEGTGVDALIELLILQAQMMELRADAKAPARGYILEAKMQKGFGAVGTLLCQQGTVSIGDYFICGEVSSLVNSAGKSLKQVGPTVPVQVAGFEQLPAAGSDFIVVTQKEYKKARSGASIIEHIVPKNILLKERSINIIIKTDAHSSREALLDSIQKLSKKIDVDFAIIFAGVGDIRETDIDLASTTKSLIVGLHVKAEPNAIASAQRLKVVIEQYDIIYKLLEFLEELADKGREVKMIKTKIGEAIVRKVFDIKGVGVIAGCYVQDGKFVKEGSVVIWRGRSKIGEGKIYTLQRANKNVKEVHTGYECAFGVKELTDYMVDDRIECYIDIPEERKK